MLTVFFNDLFHFIPSFCKNFSETNPSDFLLSCFMWLLLLVGAAVGAPLSAASSGRSSCERWCCWCGIGLGPRRGPAGGPGGAGASCDAARGGGGWGAGRWQWPLLYLACFIWYWSVIYRTSASPDNNIIESVWASWSALYLNCYKSFYVKKCE